MGRILELYFYLNSSTQYLGKGIEKNGIGCFEWFSILNILKF